MGDHQDGPCAVNLRYIDVIVLTRTSMNQPLCTLFLVVSLRAYLVVSQVAYLVVWVENSVVQNETFVNCVIKRVAATVRVAGRVPRIVTWNSSCQHEPSRVTAVA